MATGVHFLVAISTVVGAEREHHHVRAARERPGHPPGGVGRRGAGAGRRRDFGAHPKLAAHCASTAGNAASAALPVPAAGESPILGGAGPPASFPAVDRVVVSARFADLPGWRHALAAGDFDPPGLAAPRPLGVPLSVAQLFAPAGAGRARRYRGYAIGFDAAACFDPRRPTPPGPAPRLLGDRRLHGGAPMRVVVAPPDGPRPLAGSRPRSTRSRALSAAAAFVAWIGRCPKPSSGSRCSSPPRRWPRRRRQRWRRRLRARCRAVRRRTHPGHQRARPGQAERRCEDPRATGATCRRRGTRTTSSEPLADTWAEPDSVRSPRPPVATRLLGPVRPSRSPPG